MDTNQAILAFRDFLNAGFTFQEKMNSKKNPDAPMKQVDFFHDWAEANWELLVERMICTTGQFLRVYGYGSDYEEQSHSRVFFQKELVTHEIYCRPKTGDKVSEWGVNRAIKIDDRSFFGFAAGLGNYFEEKPPFNLVQLGGREKDFTLVKVEDVIFEMRPMTK